MLRLTIESSALLLAFATLFRLLGRLQPDQTRRYRVLLGLLCGAVAVAGWTLTRDTAVGSIFQVAFITSALAGLWGGWISAAVAFALAALYQALFQQGTPGSDLIIFSLSGVLGCGVRKWLRDQPQSLSCAAQIALATALFALVGGGRLLIPAATGLVTAVPAAWPEYLALPLVSLIIIVLLVQEDRWLRQEAELRSTEERFRLAFTTSPDAVNINRLSDGLYVDINQGFTTITGYQRAEVIGRSSLELNIWADPEDREILVRRLRNHGLVRNQQARFRMKNGSLRSALMSAAVIRLHGEPHILSITRDITERTLLEDALRESEGRYRTLFEDHAAVKLLINPQTGAILDANHAAAAFYGWSRSELKGMNIGQINTLPPERVRAEMARADSRQNIQFEFQHRRADGSVRDVQVFSSSIDIEGGRCLHSIIHDITKQKQLEAQLRQAQKMEAVGQLAGGVAHDFNNLLQVINGYSDLLLTKLGTEHPAASSIRKILETGQRAAHLVAQLLAFSRRQVLKPSDLDLNEVVQQCLKMVRRLIGEQIEVQFVPGYHLGAVYADRTMIEQMLMNLCLNARDAMPKGGQLMIETENVVVDEPYAEKHLGSRAGRYVLVSVTDNGQGMDKETVARIFDPFFTTKEPGKGTGLGLAMVYGIVKQHDAMINVYSEPGRGTTFKVYFPLSERPAADVGTKIPGAIPRGTETILVAEDDEEVRNLVISILEEAGYTVLAAANGQEALAIMQSARAPDPDLFVFDVVMPHLSGWDLFQQIKRLRPANRVLFMSGYSENAVHTNYVLKSGCHLIEKPFARDALLRTVRNVLDQPPQTTPH